jgi:hypothetical protein
VKSPEEKKVRRNHKISILYVSIGKIWNRNKIVVDNIFSFNVAFNDNVFSFNDNIFLFKVALNIIRSNNIEFVP